VAISLARKKPVVASSDGAPVAPPRPRSRLRLVLASDPSRSFEVADGCVVGRTSASCVSLEGLVPGADAISSRMASFRRVGDAWVVEHVGRTNFLVVDGAVVTEAGRALPVRDGTALQLAETRFVVRIGT
jgi:hypothetical protein